MSENYSIQQDLKEAEAMAKALVPYVHQDNLYGNVGGGGLFSGGSMPSLTIGALLMRIRRLDALSDQMNEKDRARLHKVQHRNAEVLEEWRAHYVGKLTREANSRLDAMRTFFQECAENMRLCAGAYKPEALRRTIVQEIAIKLSELGVEDEDLQQKMRGTDGQLRRYVQPSEFLWDDTLETVYPQREFWWLYNRPQVADK